LNNQHAKQISANFLLMNHQSNYEMFLSVLYKITTCYSICM